MRALLFHCKEFEAKIGSMPRNPKMMAEEVGSEQIKSGKCIVAWIAVEKDDGEEVTEKITKEIEKMAREVGERNVIVFPFAHLSNNLASPQKGLDIIKQTEEILQKDFHVIRGHFGSNKELLLHIYGHPGNARYREF